MNKLIALILPIALLSGGIQNNEMLEMYHHASRDTNIIIPADNEYYDVVAMQPIKLKYADVEEYMTKEFREYDKETIINYMQNLENKMENCKIEYVEELSSEKYLIFKMKKSKIYDYLSEGFLAWEVGNSSGGFVLTGYGSLSGRLYCH